MENEKKALNPIAEAAAEAEFLKMLFGAKHVLPAHKEGGAPILRTETLVDFDHVSIPTSRFEELVRAETQLDVVLRAYQTLESYRLTDALSVVFGPKEEKGDAQ